MPVFLLQEPQRGNSKFFTQDYRGAIADFTSTLQIDPSNVEALVTRGNAKDKLKDYRGAILDYNKAIKLDIGFTSAYINRGLAKISLKQKDSGCLDFSKTGELGDEHAYDLIQKYCN